ncbi:MAG: phage tail sheath family protein [Anaerolineae bacterium]
MPVAPQVTYPGVYIQEVPSDVRTIVPVDTATTAFIGRALRGPVNEPVICNGFADFQRIFGGLWLKSSLGYAVKQFFLNGGSKAVVVRLYCPSGPAAAKAVLEAAKTAAAPDQATGAMVKDAAKKEAGNYKEPGPAKEAAEAVVAKLGKLADNANKRKIDGTLGDIKPEDIARKAVASLTLAGGAFSAAKAVLEAAKTAAAPDAATGKTVKDAAETEADKYEKPEPFREGAQAVLKVVKELGDADKKEAIASKLDGIKPEDLAQDIAKKLDAVLAFEAKYPGAWGNSLCVRITDVDRKVKKDLADKYKVDPDALFNVIVHDKGIGVTETFLNVTVVDGPRRLDNVLERESELVSLSGALPAQWPSAHADPRPGKTAWDDPIAYETVMEGRVDDGLALTSAEFTGHEAAKEGLYALEHADIFNLLCIPPYTQDDDVESTVLAAAATYCEKRRAMLLLDPPATWVGKDKAKEEFPTVPGVSSPNAAIFFPRIKAPNPLRENQAEAFAPCGTVAGIFARTDATRGVWKAPAGLDATLRGVTGLTVPLTDAENGELNPLGINCLRQVPAAGYVVWGARTTVGNDQLASQWKYIPVRRTALYIEESLYRGTQWAVFEPNDEPLWSQLRLNIGVFMHGLFRQGAFQGQSPKEAYFVKCDKTTTTQADIDRGIVNVIVGFAPLKPAEFVVLYIQQMAGQLET